MDSCSEILTLNQLMANASRATSTIFMKWLKFVLAAHDINGWLNTFRGWLEFVSFGWLGGSWLRLQGLLLWSPTLSILGIVRYLFGDKQQNVMKPRLLICMTSLKPVQHIIRR